MTDEQKTALKWQFLLERSKIYLKVSAFYSTVLFFFKKYLFIYLVAPGLSCGRQAP